MNGDCGKSDELANKINDQSDTNELTSSTDLSNFEYLTNGTNYSNINPNDDEEVTQNNSNDEDSLNHSKTFEISDESKIIQNDVSNGDTNDSMSIDASQFQIINDSQDELLNKKNDDFFEVSKSLIIHSKGTKENNESVLSPKKSNIDNGLVFNHNSEDVSFQFVEDAVDPISSSELKPEEIHKLDSKDSESGTFKIVTIKRYNTDEDTSSDLSGSEEESQGTETVSIISDGDNSIENDRNKSNDIIILDQPSNRNGTKSPEVHEIRSDHSDNDDCIVTAMEKLSKTPKKTKTIKTITPPSELRRSSRAIKRKKYEDEVEDIDDESDLEEVVVDDPLQTKLHVNNTHKSLNVNSKLKSKVSQKKNEGFVIIDSPPSKNSTPITKTTSVLNHNIYQKITARGTSVTPVSTKNVEVKNMVSQATQATPEPILPTLTDDMFVVEAPSFIVPYVYEKPSTVPFKDFVEKLGKEIEEKRIKEEQELLEKKKAEKAKREQERQEKKERGEKVEESEDEESEDAKKKKAAQKAERKERRRRKKEDDDISWDGSSSEESDDESISDEDSQKDNIVSEIGVPTPATPKLDSYFDLQLGKFFLDIGTNLVQQYIQTDLLHQQNRKLHREKKAGHSTGSRQLSIALLTNNLEMSKKANASFIFEQKKCERCSFKSESTLVIQNHLEMPHMKNNMYCCGFCSVEVQNPNNMLIHMEKTHGIKGRLERPLPVHQCMNCPFEDHGKGRLGRHLVACVKRFKPEINLAPPFDWEHPAKIPKLTRARAPVPFQPMHITRSPFEVHSGGRSPFPGAGGASAFRPRRPGGLLIRPAAPVQAPHPIVKKPNHSIMISSSPRQASPIQQMNANNSKVMCEICDGYIKDLEQLRNHMQWIHKVKIHPKMIYNRPPLNCQKCQFRFFTDQGLERHLLGSHGLVTSAIQEAANKGKDAGRCPVCGRAYQRKLLAHVSRDHNLVLKPAHLSYKCTVCTATFGMYRQFENHVYSAHSVVAKKVIDKKAPATKPVSEAQKTKNSDATPQPVKVTANK